MTNKKVNWEKNFISNGDFENPQLPTGQNSSFYESVLDWKTNGKFQISKGLHNDDLKTQYLELDPDNNGYAFRQSVILYEGKFDLVFDYAPKSISSSISSDQLEESSFYVYFNGVEVLKIRPDLQEVTTVVVTVNGREGNNVL